MTKTYMTFDADDDRIADRGTISGYDSPEEALAVARKSYEGSGFVVTGLESARYGDCWFKVQSGPTPDQLERWAAEADMNVDDLIVQGPGTHPGGRAWWITPRVDVMTPVLIESD